VEIFWSLNHLKMIQIFLRNNIYYELFQRFGVFLKNFASIIILIFLVFSSCSQKKEISFEMPQLFLNGMVIQTDTTVLIW